MITSGMRHKITNILYLIAFLTAAHYAFIAYINSSYLANFLPKENLGILYVIASFVTIIAISNIPKALKKWGQFTTIISILTVDLIAILTMALLSSPIIKQNSTFQISDGSVIVADPSGLAPLIPFIVILSFLAFQIAIVLNRVLMDVYLEEFSKDSETGNNRGWYLTSLNLAFVLSPFIVGKIITDSDNGFWKVYLVSAVFIVLSLSVITKKLRHVKDVDYHSPPFLQTIKKILRNKNILSIYASGFLLEFFYAWMVIYTPIYMRETIGFTWSEIGLIFSIMLTAFVIFQLPLGKIADKYLGEKEILTAGFLIIAISTGLLTFIDNKSLVVWTLVLFMTRVGASAIEVMNDTYFFKKVKSTDSDIISFFRNTGPIAYIIGPAVATVLLYFVDPKYLFIVLGAVMLSGITFSLSIKDTR